MLAGIVLLHLLVATAHGSACESPKHSSTTFSTTDAFFHFSTTYIVEFNLQCANNVKDLTIYGVVNGNVYQAAVSEETSKHQISWQLEHEQSGAQTFNVMIYDEDGFATYRKAERSSDDTSKVKPLFTVQLKHPGVSRSSPVASETVVTVFSLLALYVGFHYKRMLTSLGRLSCIVRKDSRLLLDIRKLSDNSSKLLSGCTCREGPSSYGARRRLHLTDAKKNLLPEHDEKLKRAQEAVQKEHKEAKPTGLFAKLKYYLKRYWYIAIPIHIVNCAIWFIVLYIALKSGLDVVAILEKCHVPDYVISKVKSVPPNAGVAVVTLLLYKIATPLRYAVTLLLIQLSFPVFRRFGIMTAKEVKYKMRLKYTNKVRKINRRYQQKFNRMGPFENKKRQSTGGTKKS